MHLRIRYGHLPIRENAISHRLWLTQQAINLDPKLPNAYNSRGSVHSAKGEFDLAISDFGQAILLEPKFGAPYSRRGFAFRQKGEIDRAIADYDRAIQLIPTCPGPYNNRADAYALKGDLQRALNDANLAIRLNPKMASAYGTRGAIYLKTDKVPPQPFEIYRMPSASIGLCRRPLRTGVSPTNVKTTVRKPVPISKPL